MKYRCHCRAFTLLELIVSLSIATIILGLAIPSFSKVIENTKRKNTVYRLMNMLNFARGTAVDTAENVVICPSNNGVSCVKSRDWAKTLLVFIDYDKNNERDEDEAILQSFKQSGDKHHIHWRSFGNKSWLSFHADGSTGYQSGRIYYCQGEGEKKSDKAQIIVYRTGRSRIAAPYEFRSGC